MRPLYPDDVKKYLTKLVEEFDGTNKAGVRGAVRSNMGRIIKDDVVRRKILGWLFFGVMEEFSTTDLDESHIYALHRWIGAEKMDDNWIPNKYTVREMQWIARKVEKGVGHMGKTCLELGGVLTEVL